MEKYIYYKKNLNINHEKECWDFLHNHLCHFPKDTGRRSYFLNTVANDFKVSHLQLDCDERITQGILATHEGWTAISVAATEWEESHPGTRIMFDLGQGYVLLYGKKDCRNILPPEITDFEYDDFKEYCKQYYKGIKNYDLKRHVNLIRDFDKLCDDLRGILNSKGVKLMNKNVPSISIEEIEEVLCEVGKVDSYQMFLVHEIDSVDDRLENKELLPLDRQHLLGLKEGLNLARDNYEMFKKVNKRS